MAEKSNHTPRRSESWLDELGLREVADHLTAPSPYSIRLASEKFPSAAVTEKPKEVDYSQATADIAVSESNKSAGEVKDKLDAAGLERLSNPPDVDPSFSDESILSPEQKQAQEDLMSEIVSELETVNAGWWASELANFYKKDEAELENQLQSSAGFDPDEKLSIKEIEQRLRQNGFSITDEDFQRFKDYLKTRRAEYEQEHAAIIEKNRDDLESATTVTASENLADLSQIPELSSFYEAIKHSDVSTLDDLFKKANQLEDESTRETKLKEVGSQLESLVNRLPEKNKIGLIKGIAATGFWTSKWSNHFLKSSLDRLYDKLGSTDQDSASKKILRGWLMGVSSTFANRRETARHHLDDLQNQAASVSAISESQSFFNRFRAGTGRTARNAAQWLSGAGKIPAQILRLGRLSLGVFGYGLNPIYWTLLGSSAVGFLAESTRRARILEQSRIDDVEAARIEAELIMNRAEELAAQENRPVTANDLRLASEDQVLAEIKQKLSTRESHSFTYSGLVESFTARRFDQTIKTIESKLDKIHEDQSTSKKVKDQQIQNLLRRYHELIEDINGTLNDAGQVDLIAYSARQIEKSAKWVTTAITLETAVELGSKIWSLFDQLNSSVEVANISADNASASAVSSETPAIAPSPTPTSEIAPAPAETNPSLDVTPSNQISSAVASPSPVPESGPSVGITLPAEDVVAPSVPESEVAYPSSEIMTPAPLEHLSYQGGRSVWKEAELQLQKRFGNAFISLSDKNYQIDHLKDVIVSNPEKYGLPAEPDYRRLTKKMLESVNWDQAFRDAFPKNQILTVIEHPATSLNAPSSAAEKPIHYEEPLIAEEVKERIVKPVGLPESNSSSLVEPLGDRLPVSAHRPLIHDLDQPSSSSMPTEVFPETARPEKVGEPLIEPLSRSSAPPENLPVIGAVPELSSELRNFIIDNNLPVESTARALLELKLPDSEAARQVVVTAVESNLPIATIGRHLDLVLASGLSSREASFIVRLLENGRDREALKFFDQNYHGRVTVAERLVDTFNRTGENLRIYYTSEQGSRFNFELRLRRDGFIIEQRGLPPTIHPLKNLKVFLADPYKFILKSSRS